MFYLFNGQCSVFSDPYLLSPLDNLEIYHLPCSSIFHLCSVAEYKGAKHVWTGVVQFFSSGLITKPLLVLSKHCMKEILFNLDNKTSQSVPTE